MNFVLHLLLRTGRNWQGPKSVQLPVLPPFQPRFNHTGLSTPTNSKRKSSNPKMMESGDKSVSTGTYVVHSTQLLANKPDNSASFISAFPSKIPTSDIGRSQSPVEVSVPSPLKHVPQSQLHEVDGSQEISLGERAKETLTSSSGDVLLSSSHVVSQRRTTHKVSRSQAGHGHGLRNGSRRSQDRGGSRSRRGGSDSSVSPSPKRPRESDRSSS